MSLSILRPRVERNVRAPESVLTPDDYDDALEAAVQRYSRAKPREIVADLPGAGDFDLELPATWSPEWSRVLSVEYPAGNRVPRMVDELDHRIYQSPGGPVLRMCQETPRAGETVRLTFTGLHSIEEEETTVPVADHQAVVWLASAIACEQVASEFASTGESTIRADSVDHESKSKEYAARAKRFETLGTQLLPVSEPGDAQAASKDASWADETWPLSHPRRG